ncbi:NUDIX-domain-containing protein [Tuber magnatum]|uniref:NUDIX-domain-containing protein n=1 Tax=Tuber magnatum TaxID=42249 RepID=A0A317SXC9_9PEZI|nr:NUDIX-domain-containing protein [Tuber magnatum]
MSSATTPSTPAVPRLSASLILLNPQNELLLVHRPTHSSTFPNSHVFPGGVVSPQDTPTPATPLLETLKLCALRETFEETGVLLTTTPPPPSLTPTLLAEARKAIHDSTLTFPSFLKSYGLTPNTSALHPFTKWITPKTMPRRFESQIFVAFVDGKQVPSHDDGVETLSAKYLTPSRASQMSKNGELVFFPPQFYLVRRIEEFLSGSSGGEGGRSKVLEMADGEFGAMVVEPYPIRLLDGGKRVVMGLGERADKEWAVVVEIPDDGKKGEPKGAELVRREDVAKL